MFFRSIIFLAIVLAAVLLAFPSPAKEAVATAKPLLAALLIYFLVALLSGRRAA